MSQPPGHTNRLRDRKSSSNGHCRPIRLPEVGFPVSHGSRTARHPTASKHVARCLGVEPGNNVLARRKLLYANEVPVRIATSFFRVDLFGDTRIAEPEFVKPSLQSALDALGYAFGHAEENLTARPPTRFESETLELDPGEWVVQVLRASYSVEGTPVHTLETICAATRHIFPIRQVQGHDEF
jgi:GntR family transcriptional regulator